MKSKVYIYQIPPLGEVAALYSFLSFFLLLYLCKFTHCGIFFFLFFWLDEKSQKSNSYQAVFTRVIDFISLNT